MTAGDGAVPGYDHLTSTQAKRILDDGLGTVKDLDVSVEERAEAWEVVVTMLAVLQTRLDEALAAFSSGDDGLAGVYGLADDPGRPRRGRLWDGARRTGRRARPADPPVRARPDDPEDDDPFAPPPPKDIPVEVSPW